MIRPWTRHLAPAPFTEVLVLALRRRNLWWKLHSGYLPNFTKCCACHEKWHSDITKCCACHETWHSNISACRHQILRLPRRMTLMIDPAHIWNAIYTARSKKSHLPTSPNIAPATKNDSHDWSCSHMKRHLHCAEQQELPSNFTILRLPRTRPFRLSNQVSANASPATKSDTPTSPNAAPARKCDAPTSANAAPATKSETPRSPNTVPVTKTESHHWSCSHMKRHLHCAEQHDSPSNLTKYCACFEKRLSWLILLTYETSFTMRGATRVAFQLHQVLRLPPKIAFQNLREICWRRIIFTLRGRSDHDPNMIRPWTRHLAPARLVFALRRCIL